MTKEDETGDHRRLQIDRGLTLEQLVQVAREYREVGLSSNASARLKLSRSVVEVLLGKELKIYGLTTGFASARDTFVPPDAAAELSTNLIRSHCCSVGDPFPEDVVRAAMLLRMQALAYGNSGCSPELVTALQEMLNSRIYPFVPQQGSVGCSGDLSPLSHLILVAIGDPQGRIHQRPKADEDGEGQKPSDALPDEYKLHAAARRSDGDYVADPATRDFETLERVELQHGGIGFTPCELKAKDGLASNNGAVFSAAGLALAVVDAERLLNTAELAAALSIEAVQGVPDFSHEGVAECRDHPGHVESAGHIRRALAGSELVAANGPCGFNMGHFNQAMLKLAELIRNGGDEVAALRRLWEDMETLQDGVWAAIAKHPRRARTEIADPQDFAAGDSSDFPKSNELIACRDVFAGIRDSWEQLLGWQQADDRAELTPEMAGKLAQVYCDHVKWVVRKPDDPDVQDDYSFRASATVCGAARDAFRYAKEVVQREINAATDNPLILLSWILDKLGYPEGTPPEPSAFAQRLYDHWAVAADGVRSAANFHGEPVGLAADTLALAVAEVGNIAERRIAALINVKQSKGLPSNLCWRPGVNSGFMIPQYTAAALVSENKSLAHPATVDSIPTGSNSEDHTSMSSIAARKCAQVISNVEAVLAIELLTAYQALQFRKPAGLGQLTSAVERLIADRIGDTVLRLGGFVVVDESKRQEPQWRNQLKAELSRSSHEPSIQELQAALHGVGLGKAARMAAKPCVFDDVVMYPLIEAVSDLVRRGDIGRLLN